MGRARKEATGNEAETNAVVTDESTPAEKKTRQPVDVGEVTIAPSSATSLPTRDSKLDTEPLAVAVRDAEQGKVYDVLVDADKVAAAESILVRAGARHGVGVNKRVVHTDEPREDGKVLIQFTTGPRRTRKAKVAQTDTPQEAPVAEAEPTPELPVDAEPQHDDYAYSNTY